MTMQYLGFEFDKKSTRNGGIIIEGFSNKNVPDRGNERVDPHGGMLDNYKKNPVYLFDHGKDPAFGNMPVGKSMVVELQDSGIYTKGMISNSKTEKISAVRDLVEEGILKAFSIGFDPKRGEKDADGIHVIKVWELIEQSIVPIPMNQDSIFSAMQKRFKNNTFGQMFLEERRLISKNCEMAAIITKHLYSIHGLNFDRKAIFDNVAKIGKVKKEEVYAAMSGDIGMSPKIWLAFSTLFGSKIIGGFKAMETESVLVKVEVPKTMFEELDMAKDFIEESGYKTGVVEETEGSFIFTQADIPELDPSTLTSEVLENGATGYFTAVEKVKAIEGEPPPEETPTEEPKPDASKLKESFLADKKTVEESEGGAMPSWVSDETAWTNAKAACQEALGKLDYGFLAWYALSMASAQKSLKVKSSIPADQDAQSTQDTAEMVVAKTTNMLLTTLIQEVQKMSQKLDNAAALEQEESTVEEPGEDNEVESTQTLAMLTNYRDNLNQRLKKLGY
ncbi:MAG: Pectobacterium phage [Cyanobacteriota bacterium]|jgi:HK97 family phage prohead protease